MALRPDQDAELRRFTVEGIRQQLTYAGPGRNAVVPGLGDGMMLRGDVEEHVAKRERKATRRLIWTNTALAIIGIVIAILAYYFRSTPTKWRPPNIVIACTFRETRSRGSGCDPHDARVDDHLHVGEVGNGVERHARDRVDAGQGDEYRRKADQEDVARRPADEGIPSAILSVPMLAITKIICDRVRTADCIWPLSWGVKPSRFRRLGSKLLTLQNLFCANFFIPHFDLGLVVQNHVQQGIMDLKSSVVFDKAQFAEFVHEKADARSGRAISASVSWLKFPTIGSGRPSLPKFASEGEAGPGAFRSNWTIGRSGPLMSGVQAIGILADVPIPNLRWNQIVACDIVGGSAWELSRSFDNIIVIFEER
jgi:hypothetical protein